MLRIGVDAMGGDDAPGPVLEGAVAASKRLPDVKFVLVGPTDRLKSELGKNADRFDFIDANEVVAMNESPVDALRKKPDSSIRKLTEAMKSRDVDAMFSAGNTGAMVAISQMVLGLLPGVKRAGIACSLPRATKPVVLMDVGANVACKPLHLYQYGVMGRCLATALHGLEDPEVGLLNVGSEEEKGNQLVKETRELFRESPLRFHGHVEGSDIFTGDCDVIICDGFVGNVVLKTSEGLSEMLLGTLKSTAMEFSGELADSERAQFASLLKGVMGRMLARFDYAAHGTAPLVGVDGHVLIGHGRSSALAVENALCQAEQLASAKLNDRIVAELTAHSTAD